MLAFASALTILCFQAQKVETDFLRYMKAQSSELHSSHGLQIPHHQLKNKWAAFARTRALRGYQPRRDSTIQEQTESKNTLVSEIVQT